MTETLILHVGCPKSGTTYLQRMLEGNRSALADAGVLVVGRTTADRVHAAMQIRDDRRLEGLPESRRSMWDSLVADIRAWPGRTAILSYELLSAASAEQADKALQQVGDLEVHVVVTARDLARAAPSAWQERLKFGLTTPLEDWDPDRPRGPRNEWGWRTLDPSAVAQRWGHGLDPDRVHIVTSPAGGQQSTLWVRFAEACGLPQIEVVDDEPSVNSSLGVVQAELLRRVNGHLRPPFEGSRELSKWLRDTLAHDVLVPQGSEPIGVPERLAHAAATRSDEAAAAIIAAGYRVHGDLADLEVAPREGRTPDEVAESELLEAALETIVDLLGVVRAKPGGKARATDAAAPAATAHNLARRTLQRVAAPYVERRDRSLHARLRQLEVEVTQSRELQQRVAALRDVVTELLLPADLRNEDVRRTALQAYRKRSL